MNKSENHKQYDLEDRTLRFAKNTREFLKRLPRSLSNIEDAKQLVRSSGSVGANYIEANDSLSKKDFVMRIKICKKEAKESKYWLSLISVDDDLAKKTKDALAQEATELMCIFGAILKKTDNEKNPKH